MANFCAFCGTNFDKPIARCPVCNTSAGLLHESQAPLQPAHEHGLGTPSLPIRQLAGYRLSRLLGRGGMGVIYFGERSDGTCAAIKILHGKYTQNQELVGRFLREAQLVHRLRHPNIVEVYESGYDPSFGYYLVLEHLQGESLFHALRNHGAFSARDAVMLMLQALGGLSAAHEAGVVHRDLKPANIFLQQHQNPPRVKLLDFGVAKLLSPEAISLTRTGAILGTPEYMSPEQASGRRVVDRRADLYAIGIILFELVTGRRPFVSSSPGRLLVMHQLDKPPLASSLAPGLPESFDRLINLCLEKDPDARPSSASDLARRLREIYPQLPDRPLSSLAVSQSAETPTLEE